MLEILNKGRMDSVLYILILYSLKLYILILYIHNILSLNVLHLNIVQLNILQLHAIYTHKSVHHQTLHQLLNTKALLQVSDLIHDHLQKYTALFYSSTNRLFLCGVVVFY